jgi:hypothetical protein
MLGPAGGSGHECRSRHEANHAQPLAPDMEQPSGGLSDGLGPYDNHVRVADQLRAEPMTEAPGERLLERVRQLPGARSSSVATTGSPGAIGSGPPPMTW